METLTEIITKALQAEPKAQSKLIERFWQDIFIYIHRKINNQTIAKELTNQTFNKALTKLHLFDASMDFKTWLFSIAQNTCIDYWRKYANSQNISYIDAIDTELSPSPEEMYISNQSLEKILKLIQSLDEKYRRVIELKFMEDNSIKEIAEKLDLSESNVKIRILRAKKILSDKINS